MIFFKSSVFAIFLLCVGSVAAGVHVGLDGEGHSRGVEMIDPHDVGGGLWKGTIDNERVYLEMDVRSIGREFVVWMRNDSSPDMTGYQLARWERSADGVVLRTSVPGREHERLDWLQHSAIARTFIAEPVSGGGVIRVDVTPLFSGEENGAWRLSYANRLEGRFNFESVKSFPKNIVVTMLADRGNGQSKPIRVQWNFIELPESPMMPRQFDSRTGYQYPGFHFYKAEPVADENEVMLRWRLELNDEREVVRPIVIYVDPNTPERWRPWVRKGIESWSRAFESVGFHQAVVAATPDREDGWDYDDVRRSTLCWQTAPYPCGWTTFDPRTGELLQYQMHSVDNSLKYFLAKYVVTMAALDHRVLEVPLSDEVPGALIVKVAAHEVGHILGLRDGTYGTFTYTLDQVRSADWVREMGISPSIMNYTRFNYVAQPDDSMPIALLTPRVGPTDVYSVALGYSIAAHDEDSQVSEYLLRMQDSNEALRFGRSFIGTLDPTAVENSVPITDPVSAATLGIENLKNSIELITTHDFHSSDPEVDSLLRPRQLFDAALQQWLDMVTPPLAIIGGYLAKPGVNTDMRKPDLDEDEIVPISADEQRRALAFLCENVFASDPSFLIDSELAHKAEIDRDMTRKWLMQRRNNLFWQLAHPMRLDRLSDQGRYIGSTKEVGRMKDSTPVDVFGMSDLLRGLAPCVAPGVEDE